MSRLATRKQTAMPARAAFFTFSAAPGSYRGRSEYLPCAFRERVSVDPRRLETHDS